MRTVDRLYISGRKELYYPLLATLFFCIYLFLYFGWRWSKP